MKLKVAALIAALVVSFATGSADALEKGDLIIKAGFHNVDPKSDNGTVDALAAEINVEDDVQFTFDFTYMMSANWGIEVLAALPFDHDVKVGGATVGSTKHLPPTISALYYFNPQSDVRFYVGAGVNVTLFFEEDTRGALAGADLELDTSVGPAVVAGVDFKLNDNWFLNADIRWMDIDTDATITAPGLRLEPTVEIDPIVYGVNVGYKF